MGAFRGRTRVFLLAGVFAALAVVTVIVCVSLATIDSRRFLDVDGVIEGLRYSTPEQVALVEGIHDVTDKECGVQVKCTQAAGSSTVTIFHFDRHEDALAFSSTRGPNGVLSDRIVVRVDSPTVSGPERTRLKEFLDGIWTSE